MPELPEVESTVRYLRERIVNERIARSEVSWPRTIATHSPVDFARSLEGALVTAVARRGKFIDITLSNECELHLLVHLRMSGSLDVISAASESAAHDRVIIFLQNGRSIRFNDTRKFGRMYLCHTPDTVVGRLGVEPLADEFSPEVLYSLTQGRTTQMKSLLLNQHIIAGLGNIYVDESLWKAQIHPRTQAYRLTREQCVVLHEAIQSTLSQAISLAGTDFGDGVVHAGMYAPRVYGREGTACARCQAIIRKIRVLQRGTHFCPRCQRAPRKAPHRRPS